MIIKLNKESFLKTIKRANKVVNKVTAMGDTINIKFDCEKEENAIYITAINVNFQVIYKIACDQESFMSDNDSVSFLVRSDTLTNVLSKMNDENVEISYDEEQKGKLVVKSGRRKFSVPTSGTDNFPNVNFDVNGAEKENIGVKKWELIKCIENVYKTVSFSQTRPILNGVNFKGDSLKRTFTLCSTDAYRLSRKYMDIDTTLEKDIEMTIPYETLSYVLYVLGKEEDLENVEMTITDNSFIMNVNDETIKSVLIEGTYPDTDRLIPDKSILTKKLIIDKEKLLEMVGCSMFKDGKTSIVTMTVNSDSFTIKNFSKQSGGYEESMEKFKYKGDELTISCDADYLESALKSFYGKEVLIGFSSAMKPFVIIGKDEPADEGLLKLVLPVRTF